MANIRKKRRFGCFLSIVAVFFAHGTAELIEYSKAILHSIWRRLSGQLFFTQMLRGCLNRCYAEKKISVGANEITCEIWEEHSIWAHPLYFSFTVL